MLEAMGDVLPAAMGVALSPFPIIAIVLVLSTPKARANALGFAGGWVAGLGAITAVLVFVTDPVDDAGSDAGVIVAWIKVVVGVALLALAAKKWRTRPRDGEEPTTPGWMASLDAIEPVRAIGLGAALGAANPKNLAFTFAAASSIAELGLHGTDAGVAGGIYVLLASITVLVPVVAHLVMGARVEPALNSVKEFMLANNAVIMMVILLVLGAKVLGDGLAGI